MARRAGVRTGLGEVKSVGPCWVACKTKVHKSRSYGSRVGAARMRDKLEVYSDNRGSIYADYHLHHVLVQQQRWRAR